MNRNEIRVYQAKSKDLPLIQFFLHETAQWLKDKGSKQWNGILEGKDTHNTPQAIEKGEVYIVDLDNEPAGMFVLWDHQSEWDQELWGVDTSFDYYYLHRVTIHRKHAGKGLADKLLYKAIEVAQADHKKAVRLDCLATNAYLNQMYSRAGFEKVGITKEHDAGEQIADFNLYEVDLEK
ncbi:GNAT family N-acetyltransferase [Lacticigenium naphthae]|uniref:GNAT family N-acetyltransferase n=1 Tax=Lacticigenium naphthae TaxID=515351 RepID=UPI0004130C33|nr:GNAT family N-acetyltransferase [Lacticigenium naphthae]